MEQRTALLDQLRLHRTQAAEQRTAGRRVPWAIAIAGMAAAVALAIALYTFRPDVVPVHSVVARMAPAPTGASAGSPLLDATGYVVALREATVSAKSIYKVSELFVQEGQPVKAGQIMARLDDTNALAALEQSKAQVKQFQAALAAAKLAVDDARPSFLRNQRQLAEGLISEDTFDVSKANYDAVRTAADVAAQSLAVAKATVAVNQRYLDDTVIRAPFTGVVTVKTAQPGEIVSPQFSGGGGIAKIVDMDSLEVDVDVSENFITRVHAKQAATIALNAYPDWRIPAEVIAIIPTADRSKATVKVRIGFKQKDPRIVPEMGAHVAFLDDTVRLRADLRSPSPIVIVPSAAVQASGETGVVFVIAEGRLHRKTVRLGARSAEDQTILAGLQAGTSLATGDLRTLRDGLRVRVAP